MQSNRNRLNRHSASEKRNLRGLSQQDHAATQADAEARALADAHASAIEAFSRIRTLVKGVKPLGLLARICIQCGFHEASVTGAVESYASGWASWSGIIARLVCSGDCGAPDSADPTRETVDALSEAFLEYWNGVTPPDPLENSSSHADIVRTLAEECRMHAVTVKHDAQPYQFCEAARRLYSPKDEWLKENLGFTVEEALATMCGISDMVQLRLKREIEEATQGFTPAMREETRFRDVMLPVLDRDPDIAVLTEEEIVAASDVPPETCAAVLTRFSQHASNCRCEDSGETTALDPLQLPYEFNEICARPLVEIGGRYVCPQLHLLSEAVFLGLNFDLMHDDLVRGTYANDRGTWLEQAAADYLKGVFGPDAVFMNPYRDDGNELCDVLVYYDNIAIAVSCKAKMLTALAEYANDAVKLKDDLQKGIGDSCTQVEGALTYLRRSDTAPIFHQSNELWTTVKSTELDAVFPVYVLPNRYQNLTVNARDILSGLGLRVDVDSLPWIVSVFDLQNVAEILDDSPAVFLDYLAGRREMALASTHVGGDEMDLLGHYLTQGLCLGRGSPYSGLDGVFFVNASARVDTYLGNVHGLGIDAQKPQCGSPFVQSGIASEIAQTGAPHRTLCLLRLLGLNGTDATDFLDHITSCREQTLLTSEPCCYTVGVKRGLTTSIITYFAGTGGTPAAVEQARNWVREQVEPHQRGTWEWICLVGDVANSTRVQSVIYVPPHESRDKPL